VIETKVPVLFAKFVVEKETKWLFYALLRIAKPLATS
jgi:hypothetical protein